jgi:hypothetical protein
MDELGFGLSMFYQDALNSDDFANKLRLPGFVLLWMIGLLALMFLMTLITNGEIAKVGIMLVVSIGIYGVIHLLQWWSNWRNQKRFLSGR